MKTYRIEIIGMSCMHCVKRVTEALVQAGAEVLSCVPGKAEVRFDGDAALLADAVESCGFEVTAVLEA